ncbi:DUF3038 domain-containing protein [Almyronema epifaneia]|uniref:DUF3038 domain-containing protein n=1 Tax=Almyronema epifaneia S1 TaxID=2991925 RepID=A0ABW6ICS1_9CYAN
MDASAADNLLFSQAPVPAQLDDIKAQLDLILLALEALAGLGSEAVLAAAQTLGFAALMSDRVSLWRLRQSSPLRKGQGRKKLDIEEAKALVVVICHLAQQQRSSIRQAIAKLEELTAKKQPPYQAAILGDYLDAFSNTYQERMEESPAFSHQGLEQLALRLLIDLLFYSAPNGDRRLWLALLERSRRKALT